MSGCGDAPVTTRVVTLHVPPGCVSADQSLDGLAFATFGSLGDFEPKAPALGHVLKNAGDVLSEIDRATRVLLVDATENGGRWRGLGGVPRAGDLDVLMLPWLASCALPMTLEKTDWTMALIGSDHVMIVGASAGSTRQPPTRVAHLETGAVDAVPIDLRQPRLHATVTPFGDGALVAGGADALASGGPLSTAEVYVTALGAFDQQHPILLSRPRAEHGAVVLKTGQTLLVGGSDGAAALQTMEVVDPATRTVHVQDLAALAVARRAPVVLRLASGEIMVAGGVDAAGGPVATIEWFSPDATRATKRARDLVGDADARAYAALQGGGALAVFAPPAGADATYKSVWVIDADGTFEAAAPIVGALSQPVLYGGAGGAPILWTGDRWLRWQPWNASFVALGSLDGSPPHVGRVVASPDPGLAMWLDPATLALTLLRFDVRGTYSGLENALLVADPADTAPDSASGVSFDASVGLVLDPGRSAFVTDRTYADIAIDLDMPTREPAAVVLRDEAGAETEIPGLACRAPGAAEASIHIERRGSSVTWTLPSGARGSCAPVIRGARFSIGVRCISGARCVARNLRVVRL